MQDLPLLTSLRDTTYDVHERLHAHPLLEPLHQDAAPLTRDHYERVLKGFHKFYAPHEQSYAAFRDHFPGEASPVLWLEKDFEALGVKKPAQNNHKISSVGFSNYIGYLYVKQGSTLGGQFISAYLSRSLGLIKDKNLFFFNGYGRRTGKMWRSFQTYLSGQSDNICPGTAAETARKAFLDIEESFSAYVAEDVKIPA